MSYFRTSKDLRIHRRRLPHWDVGAGGYFVTFCLQDAAPRKERERIHDVYEAQKASLTKASVSNDVWEDLFRDFLVHDLEDLLHQDLGECLLRRDEVARRLWEAIFYFDGSRYDIIAAVVMPNHVHVVLRLGDGDRTCTQTVGGWKSYTSNAVRRELGLHLKWQEECFDRVIRDPRELVQTVSYITQNPESAGLVDWPWLFVDQRYLVGQL